MDSCCKEIILISRLKDVDLQSPHWLEFFAASFSSINMTERVDQTFFLVEVVFPCMNIVLPASQALCT